MRYERSKSIGILVSIVISIFLVGQQVGIFLFLASIIGGLVNNSDTEKADIFVISNRTENMNQLTPFDIRWVNQLKGIEGVADAQGFLMMTVPIKFPDGSVSATTLVGSDFPEMIAGPTNRLIKEGNYGNLLGQNVVSVDRYDFKTFGHKMHTGYAFEINGKRAEVGVITQNAKGYSSPIAYTTTENVRNLANVSPYLVSGVIITAKNKQDIPAIIDRINSSQIDLRAWSRKDLVRSTVIKITTANNMGVSMGIMVIFAVISGFFIIGLTLYSSTFDRIKDYGTLKAIGATNGYIKKLIMTQTAIYGVLGFILSYLLLIVAQIGMAKAGLVIRYTPLFLLALFSLTMIIAIGGSLFSVKKLSKVDPSMVFK